MLICFCLGLKFPHGIYGHAIVSTQSSVYVIGGWMFVEGQSQLSDSIFEMNLDPHYNPEPMWVELPQKLKVARFFVAAIILPEEFGTCQQQVSTTASTTSTIASTMSTTSVSPTPKGTLMIVGGAVDSNTAKYESTEIIDLDNEDSNCQSFDYPLHAKNIHGGVLNSYGDTKVVFCGGFVTSENGQSPEEVKTCYEFGPDGFNKTAMTILHHGTKHSASTVQLFNSSVDEQVLWITGGHDDSTREFRKSVQLVSMNGTVFEGPDMIEGISEHCVVALSDKGLMVIGGETSNYQYNATFLYNFETNSWIRGPELLKGRKKNHACTSFERDGNITVYVVGGNGELSEEGLDSDEIAMIDKDSIFGSWEWNIGPTFNFEIKNHAMISTESFVYVIGGEGSYGTESYTYNSIYELDPYLGEDAIWIPMEQRMKEERHSVAALIIPEELSTCVRPIN